LCDGGEIFRQAELAAAKKILGVRGREPGTSRMNPSRRSRARRGLCRLCGSRGRGVRGGVQAAGGGGVQSAGGGQP